MNGTVATPIPVPSARTLAITTAIALAVAIAILMTIVLPAEYGIDPLGTGDALGLTVMSKPARQKPVALPQGSELKPTQAGPVSQYSAPFKVDQVQFTLSAYDYVEYKYQLMQGAQMTFSWRASEPVINDFHGEVDADPDKVQSFDSSNWQDAHGTFTAPFNGIHGWYWENPTGKPVTVTLHTSGFYASAIEFRSDKTRVPHELKTP
ncbi:MAG TPA: hypothetical protein VM096_03485 [Vicinamibacterales bacterium]|nr:hypothetical protein [Vicinamibacterales bacterium]